MRTPLIILEWSKTNQKDKCIQLARMYVIALVMIIQAAPSGAGRAIPMPFSGSRSAAVLRTRVVVIREDVHCRRPYTRPISGDWRPNQDTLTK